MFYIFYKPEGKEQQLVTKTTNPARANQALAQVRKEHNCKLGDPRYGKDLAWIATLPSGKRIQGGC